jgi:hypothetical protein
LLSQLLSLPLSAAAGAAAVTAAARTCIAKVDLLQVAVLIAHKVAHIAQVILRLLGIQRSWQAAGR